MFTRRRLPIFTRRLPTAAEAAAATSCAARTPHPLENRSRSRGAPVTFDDLEDLTPLAQQIAPRLPSCGICAQSRSDIARNQRWPDGRAAVESKRKEPGRIRPIRVVTQARRGGCFAQFDRHPSAHAEFHGLVARLEIAVDQNTHGFDRQNGPCDKAAPLSVSSYNTSASISSTSPPRVIGVGGPLWKRSSTPAQFESADSSTISGRGLPTQALDLRLDRS